MKKTEIFKAFMPQTSQVFKNDEENKPEQKEAKEQKGPKLGSHFIFSAENPRHDNKMNLSHEQVLNFLKQKGYKAEEMQGSYGGPERSIIVHEPPHHSIHHLLDLATNLGQESSITSDGENHQLHFHNGEMRGKYVKGQGTTWHKEQPEDYYSTLQSGHHFTHNFDFDQYHDVNAPKEPKQNPEEPSSEEERQD